MLQSDGTRLGRRWMLHPLLVPEAAANRAALASRTGSSRIWILPSKALLAAGRMASTLSSPLSLPLDVRFLDTVIIA